jgi:transcription antitermination factor NusG
MSARWYAARIKTTISWDVIIEQLQRQSFGAYQPIVSRSVYFGGKKLTGEWPLFPAYLFVSFDLEEQRWRAINGTAGVQHLLPLHAETPQALPRGFVEELQNVRNNCAAKMIAATGPFIANDVVRILRGAYENAIGTVIDSTPKLTRVELKAFNRLIAAQIATDSLKAVPQS